MDEKKAEKLHRFLPTHLSQTSLPQTVVPPTVVTAELAALGHVRGGGPPAQAAFAATGAAVSFLVASANFLVNGVSAQVGAAAANGHWLSLRGRVRAALLVSVAVGLVWGLALAGLRGLVIDQVLSLRRDAAAAAEPFFVLRAAALPFVLLNSAVAGTLQGYGRVGASAAIAGLAAALEALGVAALLLRQENAAGGARLSHFVPPLVLVGRASLTATALASAAGLLLVQCSAPEKSRDPLGLSSFFYLRAPATTVVPDEDTHGGVERIIETIIAICEEDVPAHLAGEGRPGFAHLGLDQRMPSFPQQRYAAVCGDPGVEVARGFDVVNDGGTGFAAQDIGGKQQ